MNVDERAAVHAALGEPLRLRIVDALSGQDLSPGELADIVGLGSNLLAHHLKVLQDAGVITRVRSEGDRRRSYVQLRMDEPVVRAAAQVGQDRGVPPVSRVVFVCTANSARSQLAAARWNSISAVPATSAGTHPAGRVHPRAVATGRRHGLDLGRVHPVAVDRVVRPDDLVVAVCDNVHEELEPTQPRLHWSIPDPVRVDTDDAFETAFADISRRVDRLAANTHTDTDTRAPQPSLAPVEENR